MRDFLRATFRILAGAIALHLPVAAALATETDGQDPSRPNIVLIFTDDHGAQAISAYGSRINTTPNIDRIAQTGMLFANCFVTNAICAPSRAVILTGVHSHINGQVTNGPRFDGSQITFPKVLQSAGYRTAMIGKWHLRSDPTGFDYWDVLIGQGPYYNPPMIQNGERIKRVGYTTDIITDLAIDWLREQSKSDQPFMLMCQHKAPHRNWQPGPDHLNDFDDIDIPEPATLFDDGSTRGTPAREQEMTIARHLSEFDLKLVPPKNLTPEQHAVWDAAYGPKNKAFREANLTGDDLVRWKYQRYVKDYLRCVASVDDGVGQVLDFLDESGLRENTIVIYASDQGWFLGEHGWYDKRWMYEESLRMPLIVSWPGVITPGSVNTDLVQNLDFAPTFIDVAGAPQPDRVQGHSLVPLLKSSTPDSWRDSVYYHYYEHPGAHMVHRHYGVRTERHKLIYFYQVGEWELYDLDRDPEELENRINDPEYAEVLTSLKAELLRLRSHYKVTSEPDDKLDEAVRRRQEGR